MAKHFKHFIDERDYRIRVKRWRTRMWLPAGRGRGRAGRWAGGRYDCETRPDATAKPTRRYGHWGTTTADYRPTSASPVYCHNNTTAAFSLG